MKKQPHTTGPADGDLCADIAAILTFADGDPEENPWVAGPPAPVEISIVDHDPEWARCFASCQVQIAQALPSLALTIAHIGSTAVPGLPAKPVIDIDLIMADPTQEPLYVPALEALGYQLIVREPTWYQHRMLRLADPLVHLHVFGPRCPEHIRHCLFRDWLCKHPDDRDAYAAAKRSARVGVTDGHVYNRKKQAVVRAIYGRIFAHYGWTGAGSDA